MQITWNANPDGTATYTIATPRWEVVREGNDWYVVTHAPHTTLRSERSGRIATALSARTIASNLAAAWLATHTRKDTP